MLVRRRLGVVPRIIRSAHQEKPRVGPVVVRLRDVRFTEAVPIERGIVVDEYDPVLREVGVDDIDRHLNLSVDREHQGVHLRPQRLSELRATPPDAEAHLVAPVRDLVEEPRVPRHGDGEPRLLLPADLVEDLRDDDPQAILELVALQQGARVREGGLAGPRVEVVEAEDARVHDLEEAEIVAAERQEPKVSGERRAIRNPRVRDCQLLQRLDLFPEGVGGLCNSKILA